MSKKADFEQEILEEKSAFNSMLEQLLKEHEGEWVIFQNKAVFDFFKSKEDAYKKALSVFGIDKAFLIEQITRKIPQNCSFALELGTIFIN
jgi:hypothetical protein